MFSRIFSPPMKHGWTDDLCLEEGRKHCQWKEIPAHEIEGHLIRFVNLWFSADNSKVSEICLIVRNALLMFPLGLSNELLLRDVFDAAKDTAKAPPGIDDTEIVIKDPVTDDEQLEYEEKSNVRALHNWLKQQFASLKLAEDNASTEYVQVSQKLRTVVGFCALILMRLITKNEIQIKRCFPYGASKAFDLLFPELGLNVSLVPPSPRSLELAKSALSNNGCGRVESVRIFHLLVFQYLKSTGKDDASSRFTKQILEEGCLNVLEGNGMGLVTLFQDVKRMYSNIEERSLLSMISGNNEKSEKLLINFLEIYAQQDNPQHSWKWARVLDNDYFSDLNIRDNRWLCGRFAALLVDEFPCIFGHKELRSDSIFAESAIAWAEPSKKVLKRLNDDNQPNSYY